MAKRAPKKGAGGRDYHALAEQAVGALERVMTTAKGRAAAGHITAAARELLAHVRWQLDRERQADPAQTLVTILGSEEAALAWMRETLPRLEARATTSPRAPALAAPQRSLEPAIAT